MIKAPGRLPSNQSISVILWMDELRNQLGLLFRKRKNICHLISASRMQNFVHQQQIRNRWVGFLSNLSGKGISKKAFFGFINVCISHRIHVWYIYLHLVDFTVNVGKYTIHLASGYVRYVSPNAHVTRHLPWNFPLQVHQSTVESYTGK